MKYEYSKIVNKIFNSIKKISFDSTIYIINYSDKNLKINKEIFIECGLL